MTRPQQTIDRLGGWLSLICAVHCAVVPAMVLLTALGVPVAEDLAVFDDGRFEFGFSLAAFVFVGISIWLGSRGHERRSGPEWRSMLIGFGVGLALIGGSRLLPGPEWIAHLVLVAGALSVSLTHWRSLRVTHTCDEHPGHEHPAHERPGVAPAALLP